MFNRKHKVALSVELSKSAFTLAEVLITLGIIGVVAALTMPSLIAKHQKQVWATQLKKDVNWVLNSINQIKAEEMVDSLANTKYLTEDNSNELYTNYFFVNSELEKNLKIINKVSIVHNDDTVRETEYYVLADGSCVHFDGGVYDSLSYSIDVNCQKGPNLYGRDAFAIYTDINGKIIVPNGEMDLTTNYCREQIKSFPNDYWLKFCSYAIMKDGWKMNY